MNQNLELELDIAKLDLKGKRFDEAEKKFLSIVREYPTSSEAWCGMGLAKYGYLLSPNTTVEEVFFCFEKAKAVDQDNASQIELFVLQSSYDTIKGLYDIYVNTLNISEEAKKGKKNSILTFVVSSVIGMASKEKSLYSDFAGIGGNVMAYNDYQKAHRVQLTVEQIQAKIISLVKEIRNSTINFTLGEKEKLLEFKNSSGEIEKLILIPKEDNLENTLLSPEDLKIIEKRKLLNNANGLKILSYISIFIIFIIIIAAFDSEKTNERIQVSMFGLIPLILCFYWKARSKKIRRQAEELDYY